MIGHEKLGVQLSVIPLHRADESELAAVRGNRFIERAIDAGELNTCGVGADR